MLNPPLPPPSVLKKKLTQLSLVAAVCLFCHSVDDAVVVVVVGGIIANGGGGGDGLSPVAPVLS